jgi:predicted permease
MEVWQLPPALGRAFAEGEDRFGAVKVAMLTHGFWQSQYSGRADVLGEVIRLDGIEHAIIGVTDARLEFASFRIAQVVVPLVLDRGEPDRVSRRLFVSGRLASGATHAVATDEVRRIGEDLADEHPPENRGWGLWSAPVMESLIDAEGNTILLLLQLTVGMVILIACANVANMLLARATARARELAVRAALGAGRTRLIRQLLTESLVISLAAAALGLALAYGLYRALVWISAGTEEVFLMAELNGRVLGFTLLVSLVAPLAFGLFPALRASSVGASATLRGGRSGDGGRSGKRSRAVLATAQVSLALTLMIVASLMTRTVINLQTRPLGFDPRDLLTVDVTLPESDDDDAATRLRFYDAAREALASLPGFDRVELTDVIPGADFGALRSITVEGVELAEGRAAPSGLFVSTSPGYFDLIGLPLRRGRGFTEGDRPESPLVVVVSQEVADRHFPGGDPIGRRLRVVGQEAWMEVVGVVGDVRGSSDLERPSENVYVPFAQDPRRSMYFVARTSSDPATVAGVVREAIWAVDPNQPIDAVRTMERAQYEAASSGFALLTLFVTFALFALLMAAVGIYGVMSYSVSQRRNEIGLRIAIGAEVGSVRRMIVLQGARILAIGIAAGLVAALLLSRLLDSLVFGISATDGLTFVGVPLVLGLVGLVANIVPALRATRLDPAATLRAD